MKGIVLCACCCLAVLITVICVSVAWHSLEIDEYGLDYNSFAKTIDAKAYTEGRYYLGLTHSFVKFPRTLQSVEFSARRENPQLRGRTSDGLLVELEVSFQYKLFQGEIYDLYKQYGTEYVPAFLRIARAVLINTCSTYTAYDFFSERQTISNVMHEALADEFRASLHAEVVFLQLLDVNLPDLFENAIEEAQVAAQNIVRVKHELETVRVQTQTQIMQAHYQANMTLMAARASAESVKLKNDAEIDVFKIAQTSRAEALSILKNSTGFSNAQLLDYIKVRALSAHADSSLVIGLNGISSYSSSDSSGGSGSTKGLGKKEGLVAP